MALIRASVGLRNYIKLPYKITKDKIWPGLINLEMDSLS